MHNWLDPELLRSLIQVCEALSQVFRLGALPLETLKGIDYTKSLNEKEADEIDYSALQKFINACRAYSTGIAVLPNLHAPVLTRGDSGISVFRKVSPSVVLVLRQI